MGVRIFTFFMPIHGSSAVGKKASLEGRLILETPAIAK
jgi:hypothetical protein